MLVTRCRSTSAQASAQSSFSPDSSTLAAPRATCDQRMHAGAVRQRRDHQGHIALGGAGHQVRQVVVDDELQLPVREHRRLRSPGGAGGVEEPGWMIAPDLHRRHRRRVIGGERVPGQAVPFGAHGDFQPHAGFSAFAAAAWSGNAGSKMCTAAPEDAARYATSGGVRRKLVGTHTAPALHAAHIVSSKRDRIARMQQNAIAWLHPARRQPRRRGAHPAGERRPGHRAVAPDQRRPVGKARAPSGQQQMREIGRGDQRTAPGSKRNSPPPRRPC